MVGFPWKGIWQASTTDTDVVKPMVEVCGPMRVPSRGDPEVARDGSAEVLCWSNQLKHLDDIGSS